MKTVVIFTSVRREFRSVKSSMQKRFIISGLGLQFFFVFFFVFVFFVCLFFQVNPFEHL